MDNRLVNLSNRSNWLCCLTQIFVGGFGSAKSFAIEWRATTVRFTQTCLAMRGSWPVLRGRLRRRHTTGLVCAAAATRFLISEVSRLKWVIEASRAERLCSMIVEFVSLCINNRRAYGQSRCCDFNYATPGHWATALGDWHHCTFFAGS